MTLSRATTKCSTHPKRTHPPFSSHPSSSRALSVGKIGKATEVMDLGI